MDAYVCYDKKAETDTEVPGSVGGKSQNYGQQTPSIICGEFRMCAAVLTNTFLEGMIHKIEDLQI